MTKRALHPALKASSKFKKSTFVIIAVIRNFEIIGKASIHIPFDFQSAHPDIPWKQMTAMRNLLIHQYFGINEDLVWQTIQVRLPELKQLLLPLIQ